MKRFLTLIFAVATLWSVAAEPVIFVGHRGSSWGVENTSEAFINGAKAGFKYLECDIKVAGDGTIVISHDDSTNRLGGNSTIATATIEQLKAENYTQTRGGITYTGKICTLAEYLDICKEQNVRPLIELKWATGINSNDCSGIPALIKLVEEKGFRKTCYIMTSMKPCLEYIRTNYPDVPLQFLTGQYWSNHFDWCVKWKIDADIQAGCFSKSTVKQFHEAGLKVNVWTVNTPAAYRTYGNFGCDFMTTDNLDITNLPELDATVTFPPNIVDYPENDGIVTGLYTPKEVANAKLPDFLKDMTVRRAIVRDNKWYVLALDASNKPLLTVLNAETGEEIKRMDVSKVEGGTIVLNDIAMTADGVLLGCNFATVGFEEVVDTFKVYKWEDENAVADTVFTVTKADRVGNWLKAAAGETFTVSGPLKDLKVYVSARTASGNKIRISALDVQNGVVEKTVYALDAQNYTTDAWGADYTFRITPFSRNNLVVDSRTIVPKEYTLDWGGTRIPMSDYADFKDGALNPKATGLDFVRLGTKVYAYAANCGDNADKISASVYDVTDSICSARVVSPAASEEYSSGSYVTTETEFADGQINLYMFVQGVGMTKYAVDVTEKADEDANTGKVDFALDLIWENSNTKDNAPQNIDGTNAQQGAASKGVFYVNNCEEKKLYLFNDKGCMGSIAGGAGWGTACDDAGNIIVRDDKETGKVHRVLIYPAGVSLENPGEPVAIDFEVPYEGQTNFISASGDVLGEGGCIYMFPNKQSVVNLVLISDGKLAYTSSSSNDLSLTGSTAGYVIPQNNNIDNFVYQVRNSGFHIYKNGESEALFTTRATTSAPGRNSTGGGDYFKLSGHNILLHNCGDNYKGGWAVRDMTDDNVVAQVEPIGNLGYETGGNYSTFNFLFAEKINAGSYYIYQYCAANGMAVYRLYDKNYSGVADIASDAKAELKVCPNPATDILNISSSKEINSVAVYNLSGAFVGTADEINGKTATVNVTELPQGTYLINVDDQSAKVIKR